MAEIQKITPFIVLIQLMILLYRITCRHVSAYLIMFISSKTILIVSFCFISTVRAFFDNTQEFHQAWAPRPSVPQFQSWFPKHKRELTDFTHKNCNASYADYMFAYNSPRESLNASYLWTACYHVEDCLLHAIPPGWQANYNSANTILGLMPTLLASIGPSFAEISLLSAHRPLLSFLISMGASAIWPNRMFEYIHPPEILRRRSKSPWAGKMRFWPAVMMSLAQYVVAIGAIANVMTTSIEVGRKSILAFGCTTTFAPLLWSSLPSAIHLVSVLSYFIARKMALRQILKERLSEEAEKSKSSEDIEQTPSHITQAAPPLSPPPPPPQRYHKVWRWCYATLSNEITVCANHPKPHAVQAKIVPSVSVWLAVTAGVMNFCHVTFGIIIFSSLQLIAVEDVFKRILCRYVISSTACRLLLIIEMSGLKTIIEADADADANADADADSVFENYSSNSPSNNVSS